MARTRISQATPLVLGGALLIGTAVVAQAPRGAPPPTPPPSGGHEGMAAEAEGPRRAIAVLQPTQGNNVRGTVTFEESGEGVRMQANISGLPGSEHAYHVHVYGDCTAGDASSAGPHFMFGPNDTGITGDLGELRPQGGSAQDAKMIPLAALDGPHSIIGRSVVVHEKGNDPSQPPDGAAGARLACGVIGLDQVEGGQGSGGASGGGGTR